MVDPALRHDDVARFSVRGKEAYQIAVGTRGGDTLRGGAAWDHFFGRDGNDLLIGNGGNDILQGDAGEDRLYGGAGMRVHGVFGGSPSARG